MKISSKTPKGPAGVTPKSGYSAPQRTTSATKQTAKATTDVSSVLGIPEAEFTPRVRDAIMGLMAEVDRLRQELEQIKKRLETAETEADQDDLLPVLNRRAFIREMSRIMSFGERYDLAASLIYFDLYGFKAVNDTHGHAAGDAALLHVALNWGSPLPAVGASGAIAGVMGAYLLLYPRARVYTWPFFFLALPAWFVLGFWIAVQFLSAALTSVENANQAGTGGIAFWSHVGGFLAGMALIKILPERLGRYRYGTW